MNMKTCSICQRILPEQEFYLRTTGKRERRCKSCFISAQAAGIARRQQANIDRGEVLREAGKSKACVTCGDEKPYTLFNRAKKNPDGHSHQCAACARPYAKKYYAANRERVKDSQTASRSESVQIKRDYLIEHYRKNPCVDCGNNNLLVLQSDHQGGKKYEIARLVNSGYALQTLIDELAKCETRCANCHQIVTAKNFGFWRLAYE